MFIQKALKPRWILLIGGSLLITMKAQASCHIHPENGDVLAAMAMARDIGVRHKDSVCGIAITTNDGKKFTASGCLVNTLDQSCATIVTTGHQFYNPTDGKARDIASVGITFDGIIDFDSPIKPFCIRIRNDFKLGSIANDIAVLKIHHATIPASCRPLELYTGAKLYDSPLIHSFHFGYSRFSTTNTLCNPSSPCQLYGGSTRITYTSVSGDPCFATYLASPYRTLEDIIVHPGREDHFDPSIKTETGEEEGVPREILIKSGRLRIYAPHPQQSIMGPGGSGGALLVNTTHGERLAAIYHGIQVFSEPPMPEGNLGLAAYYVPIKDHIDWISMPYNIQPAEKTYFLI